MRGLQFQGNGIPWINNIKIVVAVLICFFCFKGSAWAAEYAYTPLDLGGLTFPQINGIANNSSNGTIVGSALGANGSTGFTYVHPGPASAIGPAGWTDTYANGISRNGYVVGTGTSSYDADGNPIVQAFSCVGSSCNGISTGSLSEIYAGGINNVGSVVGYGWSDTGSNGFVYKSETDFSILSWNENNTWATGINDNGLVVGYSLIGISNKGFAYDGTTYTAIGPSDLADVIIVGINNSNMIIGNGSSDYINYKGFVCDGTDCKELLPDEWTASYFTDINENGDIVGWGYDKDGNKKGFIYQNEQFTEIFKEGSIDTMATGINDDGIIVGSFTDATGVVKGFMAEVKTTAVPEPASFLLLSLGIAALAFGRRKRNK